MELSDPFISAIVNAFDMLLGAEARLNHDLDTSKKNGKLKDVTGVVGFAGPSTAGSLAIRIPGETALTIYSAMIGTDHDELNHEVLDGIGELANIVAGSVKTGFSHHDVEINITLPSVIVGNDVRVAFLADSKVDALPFETDLGWIVMEVIYEAVGGD